MKNSLKIILGFLVVVFIAAALFSQGSFRYQQNRQESRLCKNCHEMLPNILTWEYSSHNKIGCLKCHSDIELFNFTYKHVKGWVREPITKTVFMPNDTCQQCHSQARPVTPTQGLMFPHELHLVKGIDCVDCHGNVTHYDVSDKAKKGSVNIQNIDQSVARKLSEENKPMTMRSCLVCHNGAKATAECLDCHVQVPEGNPPI